MVAARVFYVVSWSPMWLSMLFLNGCYVDIVVWYDDVGIGRVSPHGYYGVLGDW